MARRPNYGAEKRQKEIQRQKKKDEKAEKKRLKKDETAMDAAGAGADDTEGVDATGLVPEDDLDGRAGDVGA